MQHSDKAKNRNFLASSKLYETHLPYHELYFFKKLQIFDNYSKTLNTRNKRYYLISSDFQFRPTRFHQVHHPFH